MGVYVSPDIMEEYVKDQYNSVKIGSVEHIKDSFYLVSSKKKLENPYINVLVNTAKNSMFN